MTPPALAEAIKAPGRRGLAASIHDLKLRSGKKVTALIGGEITSPPKLIRRIDGATQLTIEIVDPELRWLDHVLSGAKWDCELDGLRFRYVGTEKSATSPTMTLTFEDEIVARLREVEGPIRAYAHRGQENEVTLAEFLISIVKMAPGPPIPWVCPELEDQQPIESDRQAKKSKEESEAKRGKGIGSTKGLTVKGEKATAAQIEHGETALRIAASHGAPARVQTALMVALIVETLIGTYGPGMSNILEAEGAGIGAEKADAATQIGNFLIGAGGYPEGGAIGYFEEHPQANPYEIAQAMQRSGAGDATNGAGNYGPWVGEAREWVETIEGGTIEAPESKTITKPRYFYVKGEGKRQKRKPETGWDAIQRYAKAVDWRAFADLGTFYYLDEEELGRGEVILAIERRAGQRRPDNPEVEDVGFTFDEGAPITECTITALAKKWGVAPGAVVTVAGYGPASLGPGDPVPKEPEKIGLSSAVKAETHEGRGRYLVAKVTVDVVGDPGVRNVTVEARKPTRPLPEHAAETETGGTPTAGSTAAGMPKGVAEAISEADAIDSRHYSYESPGARGTPPPSTGPYDCSGVTSRIAYVACGEPTTTLASEELSQFGEPGEGEWFTIYAHGPNGPEGHALSHIKKGDGTWWFFGTSESNPGEGAGWIPESDYDAGYLAAFQKRHPKGL